MASNVATREPPRTAAEVCQHFDLGDKARGLLGDRQTPAEFFERLVSEKLYPDAVRFAAHLLPAREAVWWGSLCVWHVAAPSPPPATAPALRAAARWVREPTEENRRAAEAPGRAAGAADPAGALALAAFWSGGSMTPPQLPAVPPPPLLPAKTVAGAVLVAATRGDPAGQEERYRHFLTLAVDVSAGRNLWS